MGDKEVFSNPANGNGDSHHKGAEREMTERERRIREAFDSLKKDQGGKLNKVDEEHLHGIREAVIAGDHERAKEHLSIAKRESSWLYEELMKHPGISAIMRELSIMGF
jgi:hypothetical protein